MCIDTTTQKNYIISLLVDVCQLNTLSINQCPPHVPDKVVVMGSAGQLMTAAQQHSQKTLIET